MPLPSAPPDCLSNSSAAVAAPAQRRQRQSRDAFCGPSICPHRCCKSNSVASVGGANLAAADTSATLAGVCLAHAHEATTTATHLELHTASCVPRRGSRPVQLAGSTAHNRNPKRTPHPPARCRLAESKLHHLGSKLLGQACHCTCSRQVQGMILGCCGYDFTAACLHVQSETGDSLACCVAMLLCQPVLSACIQVSKRPTLHQLSL